MITSFTGKYRFLSNFFLRGIYSPTSKLLYPSSEHAYQAAKCKNPEDRKLFLSGMPGAAKKLGKTILMREDWESVKVDIMRKILRIKFGDHPDLMKLLKETAPEELVEGNTWGDTFWGQCPLGVGQNWLGRLLMEIRDK